MRLVWIIKHYCFVMEGALLRKENEFYKLNEQLELKAQKLLQEVQLVMRTPVSSKSGQELSATKLKNTDKGDSTDGETKPLEKLSPALNTNGLVAKLQSLPTAAKELCPEAALHLLKVKCQLLEQETETYQLEIKTKNEMYKKNQLRLQHLKEDTCKWHRQSDNVQHLYKKQQARLRELSGNIQSTETENNVLQKEVESLKKKLKQSSQSSSTNKAKMNRCLDENKKLQSALKRMELEEKELQESGRREAENTTKRIEILEKQKKELFVAIKKQLELIENLKYQLLHGDIRESVAAAEESLKSILTS